MMAKKMKDTDSEEEMLEAFKGEGRAADDHGHVALQLVLIGSVRQRWRRVHHAGRAADGDDEHRGEDQRGGDPRHDRGGRHRQERRGRLQR